MRLIFYLPKFLFFQTSILLLTENKLIISALGNLHYQISREKIEPEPGFEPRTSGGPRFESRFWLKFFSWDLIMIRFCSLPDPWSPSRISPFFQLLIWPKLFLDCYVVCWITEATIQTYFLLAVRLFLICGQFILISYFWSPSKFHIIPMFSILLCLIWLLINRFQNESLYSLHKNSQTFCCLPYLLKVLLSNYFIFDPCLKWASMLHVHIDKKYDFLTYKL